MKRKMLFLLSLIVSAFATQAQLPEADAVPAEVDFSRLLQTWDGFGFNYVETAQTMDYTSDPQDYGGFSILSEDEKDEIIELVFGNDGLKPGLVKMFLDPWHQPAPDAPFDHATSTANMREFVKKGLALSIQNERNFQIITTLYGPPAWATLQKIIRGRDLDPTMKYALATYMIDWTRYLIETEGLPVRYISLHNEGEDWQRWPRDGKSNFMGNGHDYNMWWKPETVADFLTFMPPMIKKAGLQNVGLTNGECSNWYRFNHWGQADAIYTNKQALKNLALITSHGFFNGNYWYWYGDHSSTGTDKLRSKRPELHAWVTSSSWASMDAAFVRQIYGSIYDAKANAFIPWAGIQRPPLWTGGDPNPGNAIQVNEDSSYTIRNGYYFYKQVSRAGQPGMAVAHTQAQDTELAIIAFSANKTANASAFVVVNFNSGNAYSSDFSIQKDKKVSIAIKGTTASRFRAWRTDGITDFYKDLGEMEVKNGTIEYTAPQGSVTTFFEIK